MSIGSRVNNYDPTLDDAVQLYLNLDPNWDYYGLWSSQPHGVWETGLKIKYTDLNDLTEDVTPNYDTINIPGRSEAYMTYAGASNRTFQITFRFFVESDFETDVLRPTMWLDALKQPVYDLPQDMTHAAPPIILTIGQFMTARCVTTAASIKWTGPYDAKTMYPHGSEVSCTFTVVRSVGSYNESKILPSRTFFNMPAGNTGLNTNSA